MRDVEFIVATVVGFLPLKLTIVSDQVVADVVGASDGYVLAEGRWTADSSACEFGSNRSGTSRRIVWTLA